MDSVGVSCEVESITLEIDFDPCVVRMVLAEDVPRSSVRVVRCVNATAMFAGDVALPRDVVCGAEASDNLLFDVVTVERVENVLSVISVATLVDNVLGWLIVVSLAVEDGVPTAVFTSFVLVAWLVRSFVDDIGRTVDTPMMLDDTTPSVLVVDDDDAPMDVAVRAVDAVTMEVADVPLELDVALVTLDATTVPLNVLAVVKAVVT